MKTRFLTKSARPELAGELSDPHLPVREPRNDLQLAPHRLDVAPERAHVHIRLALQFRDRRLGASQHLRQGLLRQLPRAPQLLQRRSLTVSYAHSATNLAGALELARPALARLGAIPEPCRPRFADDKCPLPAEVVSEILGQEVRVAGQQRLMDACDFDLAIDPMVHMQLKIHPENLGEFVFEELTTNTKGMLGQAAAPRKVEIGEGGMMWASSNSGGEIAVRAKGKVYHARLAVGITSNTGISEKALLELVEQMIP